MFALAVLTLMTAALPDGALGPGISLELAEHRASTIRNVRYELAFDIPASAGEPVRGRARIRFDLASPGDVVLDFAVPPERLTSVAVGAQTIVPRTANGHIVVPAARLNAGENTVDLEFLAGDVPLNRSADFLYTLFVPARASQTFPCFDQPDIKGRYSLTLTTPADWQVVANGAETSREVAGHRVTTRFARTEPLPTYLFAFVAGKFSVEEAVRNGRRFRMFHRETDAAKVARNRDAIFDLHASALAWLEDYTGIPYRFGKFDFVLIPSFQFGGMEHAGAILYNASGLLLDETATQNQKLGRASVIAHETAHMWFGDLVTMRWFNDVWMKEVFANFMAAKIVNPSFPEINHELRFLLAHYPAAYEVDRTEGTNAIRQPLANLNEAGSLYGAIIYQKAPAVMRQLEERVGADALKAGLREYLKRYAFANATWQDLVEVLDGLTPENLARWSHAWVSEEGRPTIETNLRIENGRIARLALTQSDTLAHRHLLWPQRLDVTLGYATGERVLPTDLDGRVAAVPGAAGLEAPLYVLPNGRGRGYGRFVIDDRTLDYLSTRIETVADALSRGSAWVTLWDAMLDGRIAPPLFASACLRALPPERDELLTQRMLGYMSTAYWKFLAPSERIALAPRLEQVLREGLARAPTTSLKAAWFTAFRDTTITPGGIAWLERVWRREEAVPGLTFSETDEIEMAMELAARGIASWREVLDQQLARIKNPDRKARFAFVSPALSADVEARDRFVASLADSANRRREPWVLEGLRYVHHPLRQSEARKHVRPALEMLREIQRTGDIFFPKRWTDAVLDGHSSEEAALAVRQVIESLPADYPPRLRKVLLSSADPLLRAARGRQNAVSSDRPYR
jgi:aminopeptidase N